MSKVLQERGFGSLPSSTETNPRDQVKSILTTIEVDSNPIRRIGSSQYACEEKKGSYGPQFSEAYSEASHINNSIPRKEKDPRSFTLPCFINNVCFDNAFVDLGASVSVMPLSTYLNIGLGELAHTKLTVELADRTAKYPKEIAENVNGGNFWDEKQIKPWSLPELLLQLSNDSQTIAEILKQREEKRIEREQAANLAVQKEQEEQAAQSFTPYWNFPMIDDDDDEYTIQYREYLENSSKAITPDLSTEEPDNSLSMGDEHLDTIPETESDEVIKSSVENLVPIPSESEGIFDNMCDVPSCDKKHFDAESDLMESLLNRDTPIVYSPKIDSLLEKFAGEPAPINPIPPGIHEADFDPKEDIRLDDQMFYDDTSSDDDSFEDIDYVEASPPDSELVSLEEVKDLDTEDGEIDTDILLTIKDDILREKLRNINLLIAKIESLNDNPTPDFMLKSYSSFPIPVKDSDLFLEKSETFFSLPKLETFRFDIEEKNSSSTTIHADISLSEYDSFHFEIKPDQGELTRVVVEDIYDNSTRELYVHVPNVLPTLPTLEDRHYLFLTYVI
ncbi:reverse transcriptase domain-containing protein [Tanacetum coccineum]